MIWKKPSHSRIAQATDFFTSVISIFIIDVIWEKLYELNIWAIPNSFQIDEQLILKIIPASILYVFLFNYFKAYSYQRFTSLRSEYKIIFKVTFYWLIISYFIALLFIDKNVSRTLVILCLIVNIFIFIIQKSIMYYIAFINRKKGHDRKRIIVFGTGTRAKIFIDIVQKNFGWGLDIVGLITNDLNKIGQVINNIQVIDHYRNIELVLKQHNPEEIFITISSKNFEQIRYIIEFCDREGVNVRLNSDFFGHLTKNISVDNVFGLNIISFYSTNRPEIDLYIKRLVDLIGSFIALILFSPFMIIAAVGIYISDGLPIFYKWNVVGLNKKPFISWKFRTMIKNADDIKKKLMDKNEMEGPVFKIKNDPRIIHFGKWLRKYSLDETPQLFSVLKGDMSLVGPRPSGPHELERYESWHRRKLSIKPGITCLWQIRGRNQIKKFDDWVKLDLEYIDNWSLLLDMKILIKTIPTVMFGKGAS